MTVNISALAGAGQQFFDNNGTPLASGKLYSYVAGTTTPQTTYTSASGATAHTNPIVLNSAGRIATGEIWLTAGSNYKFVLDTSADVLIATWDNITGINGTGITTNASSVQYDPAGSGAVSTTAQAKLREFVSVKDFGAVGDGATNDTAAVQAAIDSFGVGTNATIYVPNGTYRLNSAVNIGARKVLWVMQSNASFTVTQPLGAGQMKILVPQIGSQSYLNASAPDSNAFASSAKSDICVIRGSATTPDDTVSYTRNALFLETHTNSSDLTSISVWGNPYKKTGMVSEFIAEAGFAGEGNAAAFRSYSTSAPTDTTANASILIGATGIGQSNTGAGQNSYDVWGANFVAARTSGQPWNTLTRGINIVGIEVDIIPNSTATPFLLPGKTGATNYSGYWAQADVTDTIECNVAFLATSTNVNKGWQNIIAYSGPCSWWMAQLINTTNDADARGILVRNKFQGITGSLLQLEVGDEVSQDIYFSVTGDITNPVNVRVGAALKQVTEGVADSGGAGFKLLRVPN